jgi:hypothetical protein
LRACLVKPGDSSTLLKPSCLVPLSFSLSLSLPGSGRKTTARTSTLILLPSAAWRARSGIMHFATRSHIFGSQRQFNPCALRATRASACLQPGKHTHIHILYNSGGEIPLPWGRRRGRFGGHITRSDGNHSKPEYGCG